MLISKNFKITNVSVNFGNDFFKKAGKTIKSCMNISIKG